MFLKEITLENFLSYGKKTTLPLNNLNILIGTNASGKTNLIEAIDFLHHAPTDLLKPISGGGGIFDWLWKGDLKNPNVDASVEAIFSKSDKKTIRHAIKFSAVAQRFQIIDERIEEAEPQEGHQEPYFYYHFNNGRPYLNVLTDEESGKVKRRSLQSEDILLDKSILSQRKDSDVYPEITWLGKQLDNIGIYRDWSFGRYTPARLPQKTDLPNKYLENDCSNLSLVLNHLELFNKSKKIIQEALSKIVPGIEDFHINIESGSAQLFVIENGMRIPATRLSEGLMRYICLLAILCNPEPQQLICIEEPELGMHPDMLSVLADLIRAASQETQIIITTHSSMLVDYFTDSPEAIIVAEKEENGTSLKHLEIDKLKPWLEKYRLGQLWLQGDIGGTRW